ncbi:DNA-binding NarL/FixJ family response regulator [Frigoribacterium sp. PvP120]|jgi:DNA-binding NarL/FixJ family response regulator|uniref:response regulator transcription factor n=1 Tax=Frigoribacterium TaxID=96492 RepID=UPI0006F78528|nr:MULTISPECIES: response regulator transcription factor [Frigoribacterium]KQR43761.1 LuxR family transcriptional regulator [Frigoribacterium sp. Leaf164]MBD8660022.1 response regulator transcription factor [Frigoribacterium sp. CFBP 8754]MBD8726367.1 response regulator transcription factor [Frigoribacterium sp. CFBP 13707]MBP1242367.1 DNA-binding NarL/FixJ family response regulator [Frigoribacterium sp. PvP121]NII51242.1 DNA-binding NarL/FixJ family response regulator [Frigoribacterium endoph
MTDGPLDPALRVAVADDSVLLREGLVRLLDELGVAVVGAFGDADSLLADLDAVAPDVAVLDVRMPPTHTDEGVRAAIEIRRRRPQTCILLLSQYVEVAYARDLLESGSGGVGYLLKDRIASIDEFRDALERVAAGGTVLDPQVVSQLLGRRSDPLSALTPREREVLTLMAEGRTNAAIAAQLVIGTGAVEKNVTSIFQKLLLEDSGTDHRRVLAVLAYLQH